MEKTNKKGLKIAILSLCGLLCGAVCIAPNSIDTKAEGTGTLPNKDFYWNALNGYQVTVNKNNTYAYTMTVPTAPANVLDETQQNNIIWDDEENTYSFITVYNKGESNEQTYAGISMRGYVKDILFWNTTPAVVEKESFLNSIKLQYFANSSLDTNFVATFSYLFQYADGNTGTLVYSYNTDDKSYYITQAQMNDLATHLSNEMAWQDFDGKEYAYILQSYINIEPYNGKTNLGFNFEYKYYYLGRYGIDNILQSEYIPLVSRFRHYEDINIQGLFGFVDTFFNTQIFSGFTFGTLLFIAVGGLLVGMLLKIFLGG